MCDLIPTNYDIVCVRHYKKRCAILDTCIAVPPCSKQMEKKPFPMFLNLTDDAGLLPLVPTDDFRCRFERYSPHPKNSYSVIANITEKKKRIILTCFMLLLTGVS